MEPYPIQRDSPPPLELYPQNMVPDYPSCRNPYYDEPVVSPHGLIPPPGNYLEEGETHRGPSYGEDGSGQEFQCNICCKTFNLPARLQRHMKIHSGERPFRCEFCDKSFSVKENLSVHRRIHTKERPYVCTVCDRAFEHSGKLHRHMRTHTGERPHKCKLCGQTFVQSGQLVIHMRTHTGEKPYVCDFCPKGFTCSKQLKVHLRTHTGEKPYACDVCGKTFGYNHVLKMHKVSHLGQKLYKCTLCDQIFGARKALDTHIKHHQENTDTNDIDLGSPPDPLPSQTRENESVSPRSGHSLPFSSGESSNSVPEQPVSPSVMKPHSSRDDNEREPLEAHCQDNSYPKIVPPCETPSNRGPPVCELPTPPGSPNYVEGKLEPLDMSRYRARVAEETWDIPRSSSSMRNLPRELPARLDNSPDPEKLLPLTFFTTITGERIACPVNHVMRFPKSPAFSEDNRLQTSLLSENLQETLQIREELRSRLLLEEYHRQRESSFYESVQKMLECWFGIEFLEKLGHPKVSLDDLTINTLKVMGTHACGEPSLSPMDRIKVNFRLLLETCVPNQDMWVKFGWQGKSIEEIVCNYLTTKKKPTEDDLSSG